MARFLICWLLTVAQGTMIWCLWSFLTVLQLLGRNVNCPFPLVSWLFVSEALCCIVFMVGLFQHITYFKGHTWNLFTDQTINLVDIILRGEQKSIYTFILYSFLSALPGFEASSP